MSSDMSSSFTRILLPIVETSVPKTMLGTSMKLNEIFSSVVKHTSIRMLLARVAQFDLELEQIDVKKEFLHGELKEIYMKQPECYIQEGQGNKVYPLTKSLYELKQSPSQWY